MTRSTKFAMPESSLREILIYWNQDLRTPGCKVYTGRRKPTPKCVSIDFNALVFFIKALYLHNFGGNSLRVRDRVLERWAQSKALAV